MRIACLTIVSVLSVLATAGCADDGPAERADAQPAGAHVDIERSRFGPVELTVTAGTTVTFSNSDAFAHTVTASESSPMTFDSGELLQDDSFAVTFDDPGEYRYLCRIHPTMRATVVAT